jgi:hypothetical protein
VILLGASTFITLLVWKVPGMLRGVPRQLRQDVRSLMLGCLGGLFAVSTIVSLTRPGHDVSELYQAFPLCIVVLAIGVFSGGSKIGLFYAMAGLYLAFALLAAWAPSFGPLLLGTAISTHLLSTALHIRSQRE